ncbi:MAG: ribosome assembly protein 4 [Pseudomonas sp.]|nr:ribosome assembly protein 4 [Pseudomonas sp.]
MAKIQVLAGDFLDGRANYYSGHINVETALYPWPGLNVPVSDIKSLQIDSETATPSIPSALGLGLAGAMILGPLGAAAGLMLAEDKKEITFYMALEDGRKLVGVTDADTYSSLEKAASKNAGPKAHPH